MKYTPAQYAHAFSAACAGKTAEKQNPIAKRFLSLLVRHRALPQIERIMKKIKSQEREENGILEVEIQSAAPIGREIKASLKKAAGKKLIVKETLRKDILAGVRVLIKIGRAHV